ncbi:hypothetical protein PTH_0292 [Pelotomaculum thermopropionicum SI]|uniref:Uncharacterized protein n=1 Tax=Pelotomaculum thermopropionicum (strain DSM 13744 / JCM 10971 / SI) TaxID=370438 RepID=A5D5L7_PELTS|nr:hypothetical protein PTH_0292 [Pelotomaculum thermopropionicum SI]
MMDHGDFEEIERLLEKCCDGCLLTRMHCKTCRIEKLRGITGEFSKPEAGEIILIYADELKVLLNLAGKSPRAGSSEVEVIEKWRREIKEAAGREITA